MFNLFGKKKEEEKQILFRYKFRTMIAFLVIGGLYFVIIAYLCYLTIEKGEYYNKKVLSNRQVSFVETTKLNKRGDILDKDNNKIATSIKVYNLIIDSRLMHEAGDNRYINATIDAISFIFDYDKWQLRGLIEDRKDRAYIKLIKEISEEDKNRFVKYKDEINAQYKSQDMPDRINGVWFEEEYKRFYPYDSLFSNVIGFRSNDKSVMGLELYYDKELKGVEGRKYGILDNKYSLKNVEVEERDGYTLKTTLDSEIQKICEDRLKVWMEEETGSNSASVIAMNPNNGAVLAMASTNGFNLNDPRNVDDIDEEIVKEKGIENIWYDRWKNLCVQLTFEPGSTQKVETLAAAVEEQLVDGYTEFDCKGYIELDDGQNKWKIKCNNRSGHGKLNITEALTKSCNMSMATIGEKLGIDGFCKYQKSFGFGDYTGIDLPFEPDTTNLVYNKENMGRTSLSTNAFGQNYNCTMVQMISAFSAAVNGGKYYTPHIVEKILNEDGSVVKVHDENPIRNIISNTTSIYMRQALFETVETGTGKLAQIRGYNIGGKTGTAEKLPRSDKNYLVSFIGFDDKDNPNIVIYVVVDVPKLEGEKQASASFATKIFHDVMKEVLQVKKGK